MNRNRIARHRQSGVSFVAKPPRRLSRVISKRRTNREFTQASSSALKKQSSNSRQSHARPRHRIDDDDVSTNVPRMFLYCRDSFTAFFAIGSTQRELGWEWRDAVALRRRFCLQPFQVRFHVEIDRWITGFKCRWFRRLIEK